MTCFISAFILNSTCVCVCVCEGGRTAGGGTYGPDAGLGHDHVLGAGVADAVEALLDRLSELASHRQHRIHAQRMRRRADATSGSRRRRRGPVGEDSHQHVVVVGGRCLVRQTQRPVHTEPFSLVTQPHYSQRAAAPLRAAIYQIIIIIITPRHTHTHV